LLKVSARIFPIGYIISVDNPDFDPHDFYIDGVWERIKGRVVVGVDENQTEFNETGKTGGEKTHTLTVSEMPSHTHPAPQISTGISLTAPTGSGSLKHAVLNLSYSETWGTNLSVPTRGGGQPHNNLQPYYVAYIWKLVSYSN
jgi:microcystin-dependent protein